MFGLGADQARSVAQAMEQGFKTHFFDAMEGRIKSFKDVLQGVTDFAKNILADLSSKLITRSILSGFDALMGGGGGSIGGLVGGAGSSGGFALRAMGGISAFAAGGIATRPMMRWAGGGMNLIGEGAHNEAYVPLPDGRSIPVTMKGMPYGNPGGMVSTQVHVNVQVENHSDAAVSVERGPVNKNGVQDIKVLIHKTVQQGMRDGVYDQSMKQFGANRQAARR